ncbi:MAG: aminopeptidase [Steroidobacteraceae bacterium]
MLPETLRRSPPAGAAVLCGALLLLQGCGLGYLTQAASGQLRVLRARQPIDALIAGPHTEASLRAQLQQLKRIRDFASQQLGLPDNASYRSYADIHARYVVWNVVATPEFSVQPRQWCFPVAGCVAYRGYFSERAANAFALTRRAHGDDAMVSGVAAYSTLGRFADPVLSSMLGYGEEQLAAIVFHELAHQVAYLPGDSAFNEAFAVTVEEEGLRRYLAAHDLAGKGMARWQARLAMREQLSAIIESGRESLQGLYASDLSPPLMRERKRALLAGIGLQIRMLENRTGLRSGYGDSSLNNAHLASVATYFAQLPIFAELLAQDENDLPRFYASVQRIVRSKK